MWGGISWKVVWFKMDSHFMYLPFQGYIYYFSDNSFYRLFPNFLRLPNSWIYLILQIFNSEGDWACQYAGIFLEIEKVWRNAWWQMVERFLLIPNLRIYLRFGEQLSKLGIYLCFHHRLPNLRIYLQNQH